MIDPQEKAIIAEILDGNPEPYRQLVERYHRGLIQHLYNIVYDGNAAEDLAQEAFIKAYEKLAQYNDAYAYSTWLYKIADNLAFRYLRQAKQTQDIDVIEETVSDDGPSLEETVDASVTGDAVRGAVRKLPIEYRQAIILYYWDGKSYEEIAAIMDRPVGTIRTWLHRAKEHLRKELYGQV